MSAELCRHPGAAQAFRRYRAQEREAVGQVRSFIEARDSGSYARGEPISAVEGHMLFAMRDVGPEQPYRPPAIAYSGPILAKRRAVVVNTLIENPDLPATPAWRSFMKRNFDRILRFAHTASNKGRQVDPAFR